MLETYLFYNLILIASTFFVYLYEKSTDIVLGKLMLFISFLIIFLPAALRYNVGVDYQAYIDIFNILKNGQPTYVEPGYVFLNRIIIFLGIDVQWLFALIAALIYLLAYKSYPKKYASTYHFLFITTYYLITFTSLRSAIVFSISLIAISEYVRNPRIVPFILWVLIGSLFHKSIILIILIPLLSNKISIIFFKKYKVLIFMTITLSFVFRHELIYFILNSSISELLGYKKYATSSLFTQKRELGSGLGVFLRAFPLLIVIFYAKKILTYNHRYLPIIILCYLCLISVVFTVSIDIFARLELVYYFAYIFSCLVIIKCENIKYRYVLVFAILFSRLFLFENDIYVSRSSQCSGARISPYVSIFNKYDDQSLQIDRSVCK